MPKRLTLTLSDEAAASLQSRIRYHDRGAYVSRLIVADNGLAGATPEPAGDMAEVLGQVAELASRLAALEAMQHPADLALHLAAAADQAPHRLCKCGQVLPEAIFSESGIWAASLDDVIRYSKRKPTAHDVAAANGKRLCIGACKSD